MKVKKSTALATAAQNTWWKAQEWILQWFQPGEDFKAHYHNIMEEDFFILEGEIDIVVDGTVHHLKQGDLIHIEPSEIHYCVNSYDKTVKMISTLAPYQEVDKVEIEDYTYWWDTF